MRQETAKDNSRRPIKRSWALLIAVAAMAVAFFLISSTAAVAKINVATYVRNGEPMLMHGRNYGAKDSIVKVWFDESNARWDEGSLSLILNHSKNMFLIVDHTTKKYQEVPLPFDVVTMVPNRLKRDFRGLMPGRILNGVVEQTDEQQSFGSWGAQKTLVRLSSERGEHRDLSIWLSKDIPADTSALFDLFQTISQLKIREGSWWSEVKHMDGGFPVLIYEKYYLPHKTIPADSVHVSEELISIEEAGTATTSTFEVPEGYTQEEMVLEVGSI